MSKIVVIDDEPFILMIIEDKLQRAGLTVITSRTSVDAMELIELESPDLVILDWMMPEVSGIEICRKIKAQERFKDLPVFMLTAKAQEEEEKMGYQSGVTRYITKPFSPKTLLKEVQQALAGQDKK